MQPCAHCGQPLGYQSTQTPRGWMHPHCAAAAYQTAPQAPRKTTSPVVVVLGIVGAVFLLGMLSGLAKSGSASTAVAKPVSETPRSVAVTKLFDDYQANEVSADAQYKGHLLDVSGAVHSIDKDAFGDVIVTLETSNQFMPARGYGVPTSSAAKLTKGQRVTLRCRGDGMVLGSPVLRDCSLR